MVLSQRILKPLTHPAAPTAVVEASRLQVTAAQLSFTRLISQRAACATLRWGTRLCFGHARKTWKSWTIAQNVGLWLRDQTRVRFPTAPPYSRSPTILCWAFLCPEGQCWRHFGQLSRERDLPRSAVFAPFPAYLLSFLSVCLASARDPISCGGAGLQGGGWKRRLLPCGGAKMEKGGQSGQRR